MLSLIARSALVTTMVREGSPSRRDVACYVSAGGVPNDGERKEKRDATRLKRDVASNVSTAGFVSPPETHPWRDAPRLARF